MDHLEDRGRVEHDLLRHTAHVDTRASQARLLDDSHLGAVRGGAAAARDPTTATTDHEVVKGLISTPDSRRARLARHTVRMDSARHERLRTEGEDGEHGWDERRRAKRAPCLRVRDHWGTQVRDTAVFSSE